jgi:hypothetical protein
MSIIPLRQYCQPSTKPLTLNEIFANVNLSRLPCPSPKRSFVKALTKNVIVEQLQVQTGFAKNQSVEIIDSLLEIVNSRSASDDDVLVSGFGKFRVKEKGGTKGPQSS